MSAPSVYATRVRYAKWNVRPCIDSGGPWQILRRLRPRMSRAQHRARAERFGLAAAALDVAWRLAWEQAFRDHFGREPVFGDYRVSGVGRDEFSGAVKGRLRRLAHSVGRLRGREAAHTECARFAARRD